MDSSMTSEEQRGVVRQANTLLNDIAKARRQKVRQAETMKRRIETLQKLYGPEIDKLEKQEQALITQLLELVLPRFTQLAYQGTRTIKLRAGTISLRTGPESLELSDSESRIIRRIRHAGRLRSFTRVGKRTLNKDALKADPAFVAKIVGVAIVKKTNVIIRPTNIPGPEITTSADTLSVPLPPEV